MSRYPPIPAGLHAKLLAIPTSHDREMVYTPCRVTLKDGRVVDGVYVLPEEPYLVFWGVQHDEDPTRESLPVDQLVDVEESPTRLPPAIANEIYAGGESGMGYFCFILEFKDGSTRPYLAGNAVDFVPFPEGKGPADVKSVWVHEGRDAEDKLFGLSPVWCIYGGVKDA